MRGTYRGEDRVTAQREFREHHVPHYAETEIKPIAKFLNLRQQIVAFDIGANKGFWAKALLNTHKDTIKHIYMFDASPENYAELTNTTDNMMFDEADFRLLTARNLAIGEKAGAIEFFTNDEGSPIGSVFPHVVGEQHLLEGMGRLTHKLVVPMQTVDNIVEILNIPHVDVMKIDIEGNEFNALLGAKETIAKGKIDTIMFEFGIHQVESRTFFRDFYDFFKAYDYDLYKIDGEQGKQYMLFPIDKYAYYFENFTSCWNFVASKNKIRAPNTEAVFITSDNFDEHAYLEANPDVAAAIRLGKFASGRAHFEKHGRREGRVMFSERK
jgi:FkbM family methyltransferase